MSTQRVVFDDGAQLTLKTRLEIGFSGFFEVVPRLDHATVFKECQLSHEIVFAQVAIGDAFCPFVSQIDPFIAGPDDPIKIGEAYCLSAVGAELPDRRHRVLAVRTYGIIPRRCTAFH